MGSRKQRRQKDGQEQEEDRSRNMAWGKYKHQQGDIGKMEESEILDEIEDLITLTAIVWILVFVKFSYSFIL